MSASRASVARRIAHSRACLADTLATVTSALTGAGLGRPPAAALHTTLSEDVTSYDTP
jgi:hypothetical protein